MEPAFQSRFAERGKFVSVMGCPVRDMPRDELYAVIGFLLAATSDDNIKAQLTELVSLDVPAEELPPNDGIFEG
jgi:hypothetical protein